MIGLLKLPTALREQLAREAKAAFPGECCGLIEGATSVLSLSLSKVEAVALHPAPNLAAAQDRFEIDPAIHFALLRQLRGTTHEIIGCYHSHPNGRPEPSPRDMEGAGEEGFLWLIATLDSAQADVQIACFTWTGSNFAPVAIESE
jgi:proteasome lid subunit RPN8/RPN11